jgi:hypothetical protein
MGVILPTFGITNRENPIGTPLIGSQNFITTTNIASGSAAVGFPLFNIANPATHLKWKANTPTGSENIDIFPGPFTIDYIGIAGHNLGSGAFSIFVSDMGTSPPTGLLDPTFAIGVTDDSPLILRFNPGVYSQLRLTMSSGNSPASPQAQIAVMYCGKLLILERGIKVDVTHVPITYGRKSRVVNGMSESGNFLGRVVLSESRESRAEFFGFTPTWWRSNMPTFLATAINRPFFWAWAPTAYPLETGYAWLLNDPQPEVSPDHLRIALTLDMAGIA